MAKFDLGIGLSFNSKSTGGYNPITALGDDLLEWWEAGRGMTLSGSAVTAWEGRKNGYTVTQPFSSQRPLYSASSFGGGPGLTFDGIDDNLELASQPFPSGSAGSEIWVVVQQNALPADTTVRFAAAYGASSFATQRRSSRTVVTGVNRAQLQTGDGGSAPGAIDTNVDFSSRHVVRSIFGSTQSSILVDNNTATTSNIIPSTGTDRVRIGAYANTSASGFWNGLIRHVIVTNPLSTESAAPFTTFLLNQRNI